MIDQKSNFHIRALEKVKHLWHLYLIDQEPEMLVSEFSSTPSRLLIIGTGRHEFYKTRDQFLSGLGADQLEARDIQFALQDEWYEVQEISDTVCVVYGSIWVREKSTPGKSILVDMEGSRFTVVCRDTAEGVELCSIHHSMPYIDQGTDEYYPKSLTNLANEAVQKNAALEKRMELDHMTELYGRYYMERHVAQQMKNQPGYFLMLDLDGFKRVNDTMGHLIGDQVIQRFAGLMKSTNSSTAILGRMGGDEFAVWDTEIQSYDEAEVRFFNLLKGCQELSDQLGVSVSCCSGVAACTPSDEDFPNLFIRADQALYRAKSLGRSHICMAEPYSGSTAN